MTISRSQIPQQVSKGNKMSKKAKKKDACHRKVESRYKVFPSAYASGAIAKCRKVGAKNWGNSAKKMMDGGEVANNNYRKRPVRRMVSGGEAIANGCGKVMSKKRKVTKFT